MSIISCKCEKPEPKHKLGLFCVICKGFIEVNNEAREKLIDDQMRIHPWFEKKPPTFEGKTTLGVDDKQENSDKTVPKSTYQWFEEEVAASPITAWDLRLATAQVRVIFEWSDKIIADVDEDNKPVAYESGWIMNVLPQKIVFNNHTNAFLASTQPAFNLEKLTTREESLKSRWPLDKNYKSIKDNFFQ